MKASLLGIIFLALVVFSATGALMKHHNKIRTPGRESLSSPAGVLIQPTPPCGRLTASSDGRSSNWFAWVVYMKETAKARFPEHDLYKLILGEKPAFELLTLMEENVKVVPAEKQPAAKEKLLELKHEIRVLKIKQIESVLADISAASVERMKHRYGADYRTALDADDLGALLKIIEKTHLTSSKLGAKGVIELENRLFAERQSSRLIFDFNILYRQLLEAVCAAKAADAAFAKDTYLAASSTVERYGQALGPDFVDWKTKELVQLVTEGKSVIDIMSAAELWWQEASERARDLGYSRPITSLSGLRSRDTRRDRAYIAEESDNESAYSVTSGVSNESSASRDNRRKSHVSRSKKQTSKSATLRTPKSSLKKYSSFSDKSSQSSGASKSSYASSSAGKVRFSSASKSISKSAGYSPAQVTKHRGDADKSDGCGICVAAVAAGVQGLRPLTHTAEHCSFRPKPRSQQFKRGGSSAASHRGGRGSSRIRGGASPKHHAFLLQETSFSDLIAYNARVDAGIAGDKALVGRWPKVPDPDFSTVQSLGLSDSSSDSSEVVSVHADDNAPEIVVISDDDDSSSQHDTSSQHDGDESLPELLSDGDSDGDSSVDENVHSYSYEHNSHRALAVRELEAVSSEDESPSTVCPHPSESFRISDFERESLLDGTAEVSYAGSRVRTRVAHGVYARPRTAVDPRNVSSWCTLSVCENGAAPGEIARQDNQNLFPGEFLSILIDEESLFITIRDQATQRVLGATVAEHSPRVYREVLRQIEFYFCRRQGVRARQVIVHRVILDNGGVELLRPSTESDYRASGQPWAGFTTASFTAGSQAREVTYSYYIEGRTNIRTRQIMREVDIYRSSRPYSLHISQPGRHLLGRHFTVIDDEDFSLENPPRPVSSAHSESTASNSLGERFIRAAMESLHIRNAATYHYVNQDDGVTRTFIHVPLDSSLPPAPSGYRGGYTSGAVRRYRDDVVVFARPGRPVLVDIPDPSRPSHSNNLLNRDVAMLSSSDDEPPDYDNAIQVIQQLSDRGANMVRVDNVNHAFLPSPAIDHANESAVIETVFSFSSAPSQQSHTVVLDSMSQRAGSPTPSVRRYSESGPSRAEPSRCNSFPSRYSEASSSRDDAFSRAPSSRRRSEPQLLAANAPEMEPVDSSSFSRNQRWVCPRCTFHQPNSGHDICQMCRYNPQQADRRERRKISSSSSNVTVAEPKKPKPEPKRLPRRVPPGHILTTMGGREVFVPMTPPLRTIGYVPPVQPAPVVQSPPPPVPRNPEGSTVLPVSLAEPDNQSVAAALFNTIIQQPFDILPQFDLTMPAAELLPYVSAFQLTMSRMRILNQVFEPTDQQRLLVSINSIDMYLQAVTRHLRAEINSQTTTATGVRRRSADEIAATNPSNSRAPTLPVARTIRHATRKSAPIRKTAPRKSAPGRQIATNSSSDSDSESCTDTDHAYPLWMQRESSNSLEMIFDSGATAHLMHTSLLPAFYNVRQLSEPRIFSGINGNVTAHVVADSKYLIDINFSEDASQNLISLAMLEDDGYRIEIWKGKITCSRLNAVLTFERRGNLYLLRNATDGPAVASSDSALVAKVKSSTGWTKEQIRQAIEYHDLHVALGHPGRNTTLDQLRRGGYPGFPNVTAAHERLASQILHPCEVCLRSKSVHPVQLPKRVPTTIVGHTQHVDYFYLNTVDGLRSFVIFVDEVTNRVKVESPQSRATKFFAKCVDNVSDFYVSKGHSIVKLILSDNEGAVKAFEPTFNSRGGQILFTAAGDKVHLAERYIQEVKTILRVLTVELPYKFPSACVGYLVGEAEDLLASRSNVKTTPIPVCEVVDAYKCDPSLLDVPYGSFGLAMTPKVYRDNTIAPKGEYGLVVRRSHHSVRKFKVLLLTIPPTLVSRSHFKVLPLPDEYLSRINALTDISLSPTAYNDRILRGDGQDHFFQEFDDEEDHLVHEDEPVVPEFRTVLSDYQDPDPELGESAPPSPGLADHYRALPNPIDDDVSDTPESFTYDIPSRSSLSSSFDSGVELNSGVPEPIPPTAPVSDSGVPSGVSPVPRAKKPKPAIIQRAPSLRAAAHRKAQDPDFVYYAEQALLHQVIDHASNLHNQFSTVVDYALAASKAGNMSFKKAAIKHGTTADASGALEISTLLEKDTFVPTRYSSLTPQQRDSVIMSFTFFKEKFSVDGELEKLKARLVAGGHMVDSESLGDISSPTVKTESVFLLHALAAHLGLNISCMDVTAAYLNTKLPISQQVVMRLGQEETEVVIKLKPEWKQYVNRNGTMLVLVVGGLYGMPQAALLWYDHFSTTLLELGYKSTSMDKCVFVKFDSDGNRSYIAIHVDDALHVYSKIKFQTELLAGLERKYGKLTVQSGDSGIYVGVEYLYNRSEKSVSLTMVKYLNKLLETYDIKTVADTPSPENLLEFDASLPKVDSKKYASLIMSIYYASLRVRPDTLFTINYLSTRVKDATTKEWKNAIRLLKYVKGSLSAKLVIRPSGTRVHLYVDASYGIHPNGRSHSGVVVSLGSDSPSLGLDGAIFCRTAVQKFVTVSSTEAEMSAAYEQHQLLAFYRQLLSELGIEQVAPSLMMQDNAAAELNFTRRGGPRGRTMPLNVRYYYLVELIEDGVLAIVKIDTADMLADVLTKPFYSKADIPLVQRLLNDRAWMDPADL